MAMLPNTLLNQQPALDHVELFGSSPELSDLAVISHGSRALKDSLIFPGIVSVASVTLLLLHLFLRSQFARRVYCKLTKTIPPSNEHPGELPEGIRASSLSGAVHEHIASHGGPIVFSWNMARLISCITLLGLHLSTLITLERGPVDVYTLGKHWGRKHKKHRDRHSQFSLDEWLQVSMCITYIYASLLALISVAAKARASVLATRHLITVLAVTFVVYGYRNLWPLATFTLRPKDIAQGPVIWAKIAVSGFAAVLVPLLVPRKYTPVDPKEPMPSNPEQTSSLLSLMLYTFLDPVVMESRKGHVSHEKFPPLPDYDASKNLRAKSFKHLDTFSGSGKGHIFFGLMKVFKYEYMVLALMIVLRVVSGFASPLGINRLLNYLETKGEGAVVRPWLWVAWLFLGPTIGSVTFQWYIYIATRTLVRCEAIITQLIFEHSLRIRVKAETEEALPSPDSTVASSDAGSINESSTTENSHFAESTEATVVGHAAESSGVSMKSTTSKRSKAEKKAAEAVRPATGENLVGKINNLVTTDLNNIVEGRDFLLVILYIPLQIALCIVFLYQILDWAAFVGLAVMVVLFPLPGYVAKKIQNVQVKRMKQTDARVQAVTETMNVLRMIKMFAWGPRMEERIADKREEELKYIWMRQLLDLCNGSLIYLVPVCTMISTYATYTVLMKQELSASKVFSSMAVFDMLRDQMHQVFYSITQAIQARVSLDRVNVFLHETELLDRYEPKSDENSPILTADEAQANSNVIGIKEATFTWTSAVTDGSATPSKRPFALQIEDELVFKRGCVNLIIGPTGSGKTSLLMALLGEMHFVPAGPGSWFNLPRSGGVAYAAQESWVQNESIRDNIVFGAAFDEARYKKVIYQCALERDLTLFEAGDRTEVGEKGLTLSGGQKARVTLARAIYSSADTILLDDVLAALDVHSARWIIDKCLTGDLIRGRTILMVTHNVSMAAPIAHFVVSLGTDGKIASQGSVSEAIAKDQLLAIEVKADKEATEAADDIIDPKPVEEKADGKLVLAEEIEEGHVSWPALRLFFQGLSGDYPILFWLAYVGGLLSVESLGSLQTWYLGFWASQYDTHLPSEVVVSKYLTTYGILLMIGAFTYIACASVYVFGTIRASRKLHKELISSIMGTTLRWMDITPTSRVIARCTQDIRAVDGPVSQNLGWLMAVGLFFPIFVPAGMCVGVIGGICGQIYVKAQLAVKREMSNARAPVLANFGASIAGLTSIRAYGCEETFRQNSLNKINLYSKSARLYYNLNRWICVRIDALGGFLAALLAAWLVYGATGATAADTGFSLNMAVGFSSLILWWVRVGNEFEVSGNSLERIQGYISIEQEPKNTPQGVPPAYWPSSGDIRVDGLSARYSATGPNVLHNISFEIKGGERVGVVGRTGSGKSSLTLALLRCILTEGTVYFDNRATNTLNLDSLREAVTIIPQVPELLSGTLRDNLDPFHDIEDATLNDALRAAGLFSLQKDTDDGRITLDSPISSGGSNLSVGQRQILALARAIVRGSKLLILDEATSAIDYKTDAVIQDSMRHALPSDVTLLTVAHRLQTIMDADKIMVLDAGRIVEYDSPKELLKNEKGLLRALVDESGDKDNLIKMANIKA